MSFFALLLAFLAEQIRPLPRNNAVHEAARSLIRWAGHALDAGNASYAAFAWALAVVVPTLFVWALGSLMWAIHPIFSLLFHVLVLWFTLGFRQFSHYFTELQLALARGDLPLARRHLHDWMRSTDETWTRDTLTLPEICRTAIEEGVVASHRNVYGVLFWYAVLPGPAGAALYRLAGMARHEWAARPDAFGNAARRAFAVLDWIPARMTAIGFAIVGNFEEALYGWRQRAALWPDPQRGIVVESAAGALGVRLTPLPAKPLLLTATVVSATSVPTAPWGTSAASTSPASTSPASTLASDAVPPVGGVPPDMASAAAAATASDAGAASDLPDDAERRLPDPPALHAAVGLLWRSVVLWMFLLLLLSLAGWAT
jgi:adenosylcobinamide-phosphate synthase